jgi:hypothetical protein
MQGTMLHLKGPFFLTGFFISFLRFFFPAFANVLEFFFAGLVNVHQQYEDKLLHMTGALLQDTETSGHLPQQAMILRG